MYLGYHEDYGIVAAKIMRDDRFDLHEWDMAGALDRSVFLFIFRAQSNIKNLTFRPEFACPFIMKYFRAKSFHSEVVILMEYANAKV